MKGFRNILFDFGNVIIDIDIPRAKTALESLMRPDLSLKAVEQHLTGLIHQYETGSIDTDTFVKGIMDNARPHVQKSEVIDAWNSMLTGIPSYRFGMLEALKVNFTLLMLSNTNSLHLSWILSHLKDIHGVSDFEKRYFHSIYYSHQIGFRKPQAEAFRYVIEDSFITPSNTLFIDDVEENILTAKRLGFKTRLFHPDEEIAEVLKEFGFY